METKFSPITSEDLKKQFYKELENIKFNKTNVLLDILKNEKSIKIKFFKCENTNIETHYVVFIVGMNDSILIKLGQKACAFPRGLPIIWCPNNLIHIFGFLPKFQNDMRQEKYSTDEFDGYNESLTFFKKYSGFLGQLIIYKIDDTICWSCCSKNSVNNTSMYVNEASDLFRNYITDNVLDTLQKKNLHVCAEMMSFKDQVHGSKVLKETPVVTAICQGTVIDIENMIKNGNVDEHKFVVPKSHEEIITLCNELKFPVDSSVNIVGTDNVSEFLKNISDNRDFLTNYKFDQIVNSTTKCNIIKGNILHKDILGDILEGLVFHLKGEKGSKIIKFKLPNYTSRTMFLRTLLENKSTLDKYDIIPPLYDWSINWCTTNEGMLYWRNIALNACNLIKNNKIIIEENVGLHISAMDQALTVINNDNLSNTFSTDYVGTVVVILAPVGYGKSTLGNFIEQDSKYKHIDGDILGLPKNETYSLGQERADYTKWLVYKTLMEGFIPVISCGGGVFFNNKGFKCTLRDDLYKTFGEFIKIVAILPKNIIESYNDIDRVIEITEIRNSNGYWNAKPEKIVSVSTNNMKFAQKMKYYADSTIYFKTYEVFNMDSLEKNIILLNKEKFENGRFTQNRILVKVEDIETYKHITLKYCDDKFLWNLKMYNNNYKNLFINGYFVSQKKLFTIIVVNNIKEITTAHVTISSGHFQPKQMKDITEALNNNLEKLELEKNNKDKEKIIFNLPKLTDCKISNLLLVDHYCIT